MQPLNFKVLLIGGASGTGKTYLAKHLSKILSINYLNLDSFRWFTQHIIKSDIYPELFVLFNNDPLVGGTKTIEFLIKAHYDLAKFLSPGINALINKLEFSSEPVIIEGNDIYPEFLDINNNVVVKGIFLFDDFEYLYKQHLGRARNNMENSAYEKSAQVAHKVGNYIKEFAQKCKFYSMKSSPQDSAIDRALLLLQNT